MLRSKRLIVSLLGYSLFLVGCSSGHHEVSEDQKLKASALPLPLGTITQCQKYSGLPEAWLSSATAGMVEIPAGTFRLGSALAYPDELNFGAKQRQVKHFWIDQTEVTVAQFESFVKATHYVTDAEQQKQAAVFSPDPTKPDQWWQLKSDYNWKYPNGPHARPAQPNEAVRFVTKTDAEHYALWLGRDLATEIEWEYAAKAGETKDTPLHQAPLNHKKTPLANYWQGEFPFQNLKQDQFESVAPVGCFPANAYGVYDQIGNLWEWTSSAYQGAHDQHMGDYQSLRQQQHRTQNFVIKGGSYLCADNYCARYRNSSRHPQEFNLATSHVGFRTILRP